MTDNWQHDFTPILKLEERKSPNWFRVYCFINGRWERTSKHRNEVNAYINRDVKRSQGNLTKITYKRKIVAEDKVFLTPEKGEK